MNLSIANYATIATILFLSFVHGSLFESLGDSDCQNSERDSEKAAGKELKHMSLCQQHYRTAMKRLSNDSTETVAEAIASFRQVQDLGLTCFTELTLRKSQLESSRIAFDMGKFYSLLYQDLRAMQPDVTFEIAEIYLSPFVHSAIENPSPGILEFIAMAFRAYTPEQLQDSRYARNLLLPNLLRLEKALKFPWDYPEHNVIEVLVAELKANGILFQTDASNGEWWTFYSPTQHQSIQNEGCRAHFQNVAAFHQPDLDDASRAACFSQFSLAPSLAYTCHGELEVVRKVWGMEAREQWVLLATRFYASSLEAQPNLQFRLPLEIVKKAVYLAESVSDTFSKLILMGAAFDQEPIKELLISIRAVVSRPRLAPEFRTGFLDRIAAKRCIIIDALLAQI